MLSALRYDRLPTERRNPRSHDLDRLSIPQLLRLMNQEDATVPAAIRRVIPDIAKAVSFIVTALRAGGRLWFLGAGTSGRLGILEAAECPPTFHTPASLVQGVIAGGRAAVFRSQEGAEDDRRCATQIVRQRLRRHDVVVGIAASGVTPFVEQALKMAKTRGARTILVSCNPSTSIPATVRIRLAVGPEVLTGSTRLKAGTATKLVLNMLTLGAMVQLGKTYGNLMVDVRPTSRKLRARALSMIQSLASCDLRTAARCLEAAHGQTKVAVLMAKCHVSTHVAKRRLARVNGSLRRALRMT